MKETGGEMESASAAWNVCAEKGERASEKGQNRQRVKREEIRIDEKGRERVKRPALRISLSFYSVMLGSVVCIVPSLLEPRVYFSRSPYYLSTTVLSLDHCANNLLLSNFALPESSLADKLTTLQPGGITVATMAIAP